MSLNIHMQRNKQIGQTLYTSVYEACGHAHLLAGWQADLMFSMSQPYLQLLKTRGADPTLHLSNHFTLAFGQLALCHCKPPNSG